MLYQLSYSRVPSRLAPGRVRCNGVDGPAP